MAIKLFSSFGATGTIASTDSLRVDDVGLSAADFTITLPNATSVRLVGGGKTLTFSGTAITTFVPSRVTFDDTSKLLIGDRDIGPGDDGPDTLQGLGQDDQLWGLGGNDVLNGGAGGDKMVGGDGDDTYVVNDALDVVIEKSGAVAGTGDLVKSSLADYTLGDFVEKLLLTGTASINGAGNSLANEITGNSGNNLLSGGNETLVGLDGVDTLRGMDGDDTLDGGTGADVMQGGKGNDTYVVNVSGDIAEEESIPGSGTADLVQSTAPSYALGANVENLTLAGTANISGSGNSLRNVITGNSGNNALNGYIYLLGDLADTLSGMDGADTLDGGTGGDSMVGGKGNDVYFVDNANDKTVEDSIAGSGIDRVEASVSHTLKVNVEKLTLIGAAANGTGNTKNNTITGNDEANHLKGLGANDVLVGNGGVDWLEGASGNDSVTYDPQDQIDGGGGGYTDTLKVEVQSLDLFGLAGDELTGIEAISLAYGGGSLINLTAQQIKDLSDTDTLRVLGDGLDAVSASGVWQRIDDTVIGGQTYKQYTHQGATLRVDEDIQQDGIHLPASSLNVTALDGGNGFKLTDPDTHSYAGRSVSSAGDVDGDGFGDFIVGASAGFSATSGKAYVVFGDAGGFDASIDLTAVGSLDGANGFVLSAGYAGDNLGYSVSSAGDMNGDGFGDFVIGAYGTGGDGRTYVVFGRNGGFPSSFDLVGLDGDNGFKLFGGDGDASGYAVASAGDFNGDGYDDLLVNAPDNGYTYLVFGHGSIESALDLSALGGADGFTLAASGNALAGGDFNGDGYSDIVVTESDDGKAYVVFGSESGSAPALSTLDGSNGFVVMDAVNLGESASFGDLNGDGRDDLILGSRDAHDGTVHVVFGTEAGFGSSFDVTALDGTNGFAISGAKVQSYPGAWASFAGDVNGDGFGDLFVGSSYDGASGIEHGTGYVVYGHASGFDAVLDLSALDGTNGFAIVGTNDSTWSFWTVAGAGDIDGNGFADLIGGSPYDLYPDSNGSAHVILGGDFTGTAAIMGTADDDTLVGTGDGAAFHAGAGNDRIVLAAGYAGLIDGGAGNYDVIVADTQGDVIELGSADGLAGIEQLDLTGSHNNQLVVSTLGVVNASDTSNSLLVHGNAGDSVSLEGTGWSYEANGEGYRFYVNGAAQVTVATELAVTADAPFSAYGLGVLDGTNGFALVGVNEYDNAGFSVSSAGDVNLDGFDDVLVGTTADSVNGGAAYVVFGKEAGFAASLELSALDGVNGFKIGGTAGDSSGAGYAVASAGDINGDGAADMIVGAPFTDSNGSESGGAAYVVFGKPGGGFDPTVELSTLDGTNGFQLPNPGGILANYDAAGNAVASVDLNGDGLSDLVVAAQRAFGHGDYAGVVYVVFGSSDAFAPVVELSGLDGANGLRIFGGAEFDQAGHSVASAGDVNGDGVQDLLIGAWQRGGSDAGAAYVVYGSTSGFAASGLDLVNIDGTNGFILNGVADYDHAGYSVSSAGDVNGDGRADLIVGATGADLNGSDSGASYVVFTPASGFGSSVDLSSLDGANGFRVTGGAAGDFAGVSVSGGGDINGDGYDDLVVGSQAGNAGAAYIVFGGGAFGSSLDVSSLDGGNGFNVHAIALYDAAGSSVSATGDVNGDGFADLIVGAYGTTQHGQATGTAYVFFGGDVTDTAGIMGTAQADTLQGTQAGDVFHAGAGDDLMVVVGGEPFMADGGAGFDTVNLDDAGALLDGNGRHRSIEAIDLAGENENHLVLTKVDVLNASDTSNELVVTGDVGSDSLMLVGNWTQEGNQWLLEGATVTVQAGLSLSVQSTPPDLSTLNGSNGFRIVGEAANDYSGWSVSIAGDIDGDGFDDVVIGAPQSLDDYGAAYVVFGDGAGLPASLALSALDGANGFQITGAGSPSAVGFSVSGAGDVNADGFADVLVGAPHNGSGVYVLYGTDTGFAPSLELSSLDGSNGFLVSAQDVDDNTGISVSAAGDVNGDGFADFVVGATLAEGTRGAAFVVFGTDAGFSDFSLSALDGDNGFRIVGEGLGDHAAKSVSAAGDVNGDGYSDLIVGASDVDAAYVVFGDASPFADVELSALNGTNGFQVAGEVGSETGGAVSSAGDFNRDGFADLLIGASRYGEDDEGQVYVVYGRDGAMPSNVSALDGVNGFRIDGLGEYDNFGLSVASAGDVNGDGYDDIIVGAWGVEENHGAAYVIFGGEAPAFGSSFDLSTLDDTNGFRLLGENDDDNTGRSVSGAGDVNGDGFDDIVVGSYYAGANGQGATHVVFGGNFSGAVDVLGTAAIDVLIGTSAGNVMVGGLRDDTLIGGDGNDTLTGAAGADTFQFGMAPSETNHDVIRDFVSGVDHLELDSAIFSTFVPDSVISERVQVALESQISDTSGDDGLDGHQDNLKYATDTGNLYYDANGVEAGGLSLIVQLLNDGSPAGLQYFPVQDLVIYAAPT